MAGQNITNIERIVHFAVGGNVWDNLIVDWSRSGSATELELAASDYNGNNVTVTNLASDDFVIVSGTDIGTLSLSNVNPIGLTDYINLELETVLGNSALPLIDNLVIPTTTEILNLVVSGPGGAVIDDASNIDTDVILTGTGNLRVGSSGETFDFDTGVIDASDYEGDLFVVTGNGNQAIVGGLGDDVIALTTNGGYVSITLGTNADVVELLSGGNDVVQFQAFYEFASGTATNANYHLVNGFETADDVLAFNAAFAGGGGGAAFFTLGGVDIAVGADVQVMSYQAGTVINGTLPGLSDSNFIKFTTAAVGVNLTVNDIVDQAFGVGSIAVNNAISGAAGVLASAYDVTSGVMVLFTIEDNDNNPGNLLTAADDVDVLGLVTMTQAEYNAFGMSNIDFVGALV